MNEFKIDKGIPMPRTHSRKLSPMLVALRKLEVGDSVLVENATYSLYAKIANLNRANTKKYATRKMPDGYRVWRVS